MQITGEVECKGAGKSEPLSQKSRKLKAQDHPGLFLLFTGPIWYESDQIRITYIDTRL